MRTYRNRKTGSSAVELCLALFIIVPLVVLAIDAGFLFFGCAFASTACREAARWASNGQPADVTQPHSGLVASNTGPYTRAVNALATFHTSKFAAFSSMQVSETITDPVPTSPFGGMANGNVTVSMQATVAPPIPLPMIPTYVQFPVQESFPYTWVMPATPS